MTHRWILLLCAYLCVSGPAHAALPPDAQEYLDKFPGKTLTVDLIVGKSIESSDSFRQVQAEFARTFAVGLRGLAPFDPRLTFSILRGVDTKEPASPFGTTRTELTKYSLGFSKYFSTGTQLGLDLYQASTQYTFSSAFPITQGLTPNETYGKLTISQNLWKDFFGEASRKEANAAELQTEAAKLGFGEGLETWAQGIMQIYYQAELGQAQTRAAEDNLARRERLLKITRIRLSRGTAEKPDVLQAESAKISSEIQFERTKQGLTEIWRQLVTALKFPKHWIDIDPMEIPLKKDEPISDALQACGTDKKLNTAPKETPVSKRAQLEAEAARLNAEAARHRLWPDLKLTGTYETNGVDQATRSGSFSEFSKLLHPAWSVNVMLTVPFSMYAEKAALANAIADRDKFEASASIATADVELNWRNACADLQRLKRANNDLKEATQKQRERVQLQERRYGIGRGTLFDVIQAGDDATQTEIAFQDNEMQIRLAAWKVQRLVGGMKTYLEKITQRSPLVPDEW